VGREGRQHDRSAIVESGDRFGVEKAAGGENLLLAGRLIARQFPDRACRLAIGPAATKRIGTHLIGDDRQERESGVVLG
jgi:hypothetical protein